MYMMYSCTTVALGYLGQRGEIAKCPHMMDATKTFPKILGFEMLLLLQREIIPPKAEYRSS